MLPRELYFRGTLVQYYQAIYAEYLRLSSLHGREPFKFLTPNQRKRDLEKYQPAYYEVVEIAFGEDQYQEFLLHVKASTLPGEDRVKLLVEVNVNYLVQHGGACLSIWQAVEASLAAQGWLAHPSAPLPADKPQMPSRPQKGSALTLWFDWYHSMLEAGHKCTLPEIARQTSHSLSHIKRLHANYVRERRRTP